MIDAQSIGCAAAHELDHEPVGLGEDLGPLHGETDQRVDVEEPPVPKIPIRGLPPGETIVLLIEQLVQGIRVRVRLGDHAIECARDARLVLQEIRQHLMGGARVSPAALDRARIGLAGWREDLECIGDELQPFDAGVCRGLPQGTRE